MYPRKGKRGTSWYIDFRDQNGKRVSKAVGTKKRAQIKAADIESALFRVKFEGLPAVQKDTKIEPFIARYFNYVSKKNAPSTVREDKH